MAYKGLLPSDLWGKYDCEGGMHKLILDLNVAANINKMIGEASGKATNPKDAVARRNQKRKKRQLLKDSNDVLNMLRESGVPTVRANSGDKVND